MFNKEQIKKFNQLELKIYEYIINHEAQIPYMSIREPADNIPTSTASILRFCRKIGFEGFKEFKYAYKKIIKKDISHENYDLLEIIDCLKKFNTTYYQKLFNEAITILDSAKSILFLGVGDSGIIAQYGARRFSSCGRYASAINDPYYKIKLLEKDSIVIVLTISGETESVIKQVHECKKNGSKILSITTTKTSTISKMSDLTIPYYINRNNNEKIELTSQVPAMIILEILSKTS